MKSLPILVLAASSGCGLAASNGSFEAGLRAYREGRFQAALEAWTRAESEAGEAASSELCFDRALAALQVGALAEARAAAERAAEHGGAPFAARREFVQGNVAFARSRQSALQAAAPEAEPFAWDVALEQAAQAKEAWQRAVLAGLDTEAARRNVERALLWIEELESAKQSAAERRARAEKTPNRPNEQPEEAPGEVQESERAAQELLELEAQADALAEGDIEELLERLGAKEEEKRATRRARHARGRSLVEQDW